MKSNRIYYWACFMITVILTLAFLYNAAPAIGNDELFLNGVVKQVNTKSKLVTIDVKSSSCKGEKSFEVSSEDIEIFQDVLNKEVGFYIDDSTCKEYTRYKIKQVRLKAAPKGVKQ